MSGLQSSFKTPQASPGFLLWQVSNQWQAKQRQALATYGLTHVQFVLLASLVWAMGETTMTQKQLALHAKTDVMMTSQVVRTLEKKKLLVRKASLIDGRALTLTPTKQGIDVVDQALQAVEAVDRHFFDDLGGDLSSFIKMMHLLAK